MGTASSSTRAAPRRALPTRAGRIRTMPSSTPTARLAEGPIALVEVQGYVYAAKQLAARCARSLGHGGAGAPSSRRRPKQLRRALRGGLLVRGDRHLCAGARRRQVALQGAHQQCRPCALSRASPGPTARAASPRGCCSPPSIPAGASAPSPRARRATIRCPITTDRSGRTTTR